jgi:hypothetical protein
MTGRGSRRLNILSSRKPLVQLVLFGSSRQNRSCRETHLLIITTNSEYPWINYSPMLMARQALARPPSFCPCVLRLIALPANLASHLPFSEQSLQVSLLATSAAAYYTRFFDYQSKIRRTSYCLLVAFVFFTRSSRAFVISLLMKSLCSPSTIDMDQQETL